jgi:hypothetical protein
VASELVEQSLEKTTSGEAGESCVNEAVFKTPLKPGDVMNYDAVRCHWNDGPVTGAVFHLSDQGGPHEHPGHPLSRVRQGRVGAGDFKWRRCSARR